MAHLLDEAALERQARQPDQSGSENGDDYVDEILERRVRPGDTVRIRLGTEHRRFLEHATCDDGPDLSEVVGLALDTPDVVLRTGDYHVHDDDDSMIPVWICCPAFCGDPRDLIRIVHEDHLEVLERPCDPNMYVVTRAGATNTSDNAVDLASPEAPKAGVVCSSQVSFHAVKVRDVLAYHTKHRYGAKQLALAKELAKADGVGSYRHLAGGVDGLHAVMRHFLSDFPDAAVRATGDFLVRANPFPVGRFIRSHRCVLDAPTVESQDRQRDDIHYDPNRVNMLNNAPSDTGEQRGRVPFFGHVHRVDYACLVELFVPPSRGGNGQSKKRACNEPGAMAFVILIPAAVVSSCINDNDEDQRKLTIHNLYQRSQEPSDDNSTSTAPPHVDHVAPLMYAENIHLMTLQHEVIWIRGSFEEYHKLLVARMSPGSALVGNGIVVFSFPETITALELIDGFPMEFHASEIMSMETDGHDSCMVGHYGFVLSSDDVQALQEGGNVETCEFDSATSEMRDIVRNCTNSTLLPADALHRWYQSKGIIPASVDEDWSVRLQKLLPIVNDLAVLTRVWSSSSVLWEQKTTSAAADATPSPSSSLHVECVPSHILIPIDRMDTSEIHFAPLDIVAASPLYQRDKFASLLAQGDQLSHRHERNATFLMEDVECSTFDVVRVYDNMTDLSVSEVVRPRLHREPLMDQPDGESDPHILGIVTHADHASGICSVRWYRQPLVPSELISRRPTDVGQILELLPNTLVRVRWNNGDVEDCPREQLMPCREFFNDEEDDEEFEEDEEEADDGERAEVDAPIVVAQEEELQVPQQQNDGQAPASGLHGLLRAVAGAIASVLPHRDRDPPAASPQRPATHVDAPSTSLAPQDDSSFIVPPLDHVAMFAAHQFEEELSSVNEASMSSATSKIFARRLQGEWRDIESRIPSLGFTPSAGDSGTNSAGVPCKQFPPVLVRLCKETQRVMKFALLGPLHTPYYQSLLCFDVFLGSDFPLAPPQARFHSYNMRLNPNLYNDGHICLSLLGTWNGMHQSESWNPATSTLVQLMLSIQSLVLVKEPYYNEAGFEDHLGTPHGRVASKEYNESLALARIRFMMECAERPPSDWMFVVRRHLEHFGPRIHDRLCHLLKTQETAGAHGETEGTITADGLVLPLTKGFIVAMKRQLAAFKDFMERKFAQWKTEEEAVSLPHFADA